MKYFSSHIFVFLIWSATGKCKNVENVFRDEVGAFGRIIKQILESLRPSLASLHINSVNFDTGAQEFGNFTGNVNEVIVEGLDKFNVKVIKTTFFDINNITVEDDFTAKGFYHLDGSLAFPLGKNDIQLFGGGEFSAKFTNFSISAKMKIRLDSGEKVVRDFDILVGLHKIEVYFKNLMGGGDLERTFNVLINDVGLTVFNYYKQPVLNIVKPQIITIITYMLNSRIKNDLLT